MSVERITKGELLRDAFVGTVFDSAKWSITYGTPAQISQNERFLFQSLAATTYTISGQIISLASWEQDFVVKAEHKPTAYGDGWDPPLYSYYDSTNWVRICNNIIGGITGIRVYKNVAGTVTLLATYVTTTTTVTYISSIRKVGTTIYYDVYEGDVARISDSTTVSTAPTKALLGGFVWTGSYAPGATTESEVDNLAVATSNILQVSGLSGLNFVELYSPADVVKASAVQSEGSADLDVTKLGFPFVGYLKIWKDSTKTVLVERYPEIGSEVDFWGGDVWNYISLRKFRRMLMGVGR